MKKNFIKTATGLMLAGSMFLFACSGNNASGPHGEGPAFTSAHVCPMHCEGSGAAEAGKCPVCGMDYVTNAEHMKDGHKH